METVSNNKKTVCGLKEKRKLSTEELAKKIRTQATNSAKKNGHGELEFEDFLHNNKEIEKGE